MLTILIATAISVMEKEDNLITKIEVLDDNNRWPPFYDAVHLKQQISQFENNNPKITAKAIQQLELKLRKSYSEFSSKDLTILLLNISFLEFSEKN